MLASSTSIPWRAEVLGTAPIAPTRRTLHISANLPITRAMGHRAGDRGRAHPVQKRRNLGIALAAFGVLAGCAVAIETDITLLAGAGVVFALSQGVLLVAEVRARRRERRQ
jgi:hypothetical protein